MHAKFKPPLLLRSATVQTILASLKFEKLKQNAMCEQAKLHLIQAGKKVRLIGYLSKQMNKNPKGLVLLLHGWEGHINSAYILKTGAYLYNNGFDIFRINLRDHGGTHHLNEGIFNGSLLEETFTAAKEVAKLADKNNPFFITGFSLGGNFALRIAKNNNKKQIPNLKHAVAISPAIHPKSSTEMMDENPFLRKYFLKEWMRSLNEKERLFPFLYNFDKYKNADTVMNLTESIIPDYSPYKSADEYFQTYTLIKDYFKDLKTPTTIITAKDDPVVHPEDFYGLTPNPNLQVLIENYGGHNGFFNSFKLDCYYLPILQKIFSK
ncbi:MAG: alpha/beta fold hydrolase [Leptospiraceae bacterium]|nr:alpha/beta fold hydrolase [Leptospiraceae bacterium]